VSSIERTAISGLVSFPLMAAMHRLRCLGVSTSVIVGVSLDTSAGNSSM
jgi:hypothetical protein